MGKTREQMPKSGSQKRCEFVDTSCYIYEIPYSLYEAVYTLLDENTPWAQIAKEMQFNELELLVRFSVSVANWKNMRMRKSKTIFAAQIKYNFLSEL